jgi:CRISPR system Cascade subunit CasC
VTCLDGPDASAQVAHAISVNKVSQEYDYFTAVDDCAAEDNAGAAMLDTIGFNSSTLYRYATVCLPSLEEQLGDAETAAQGVRAFLKAFVESMPAGKRNTFANRTLPSTVLVVLRDDQPVVSEKLV